MKQGILTTDRVRLMMSKGESGPCAGQAVIVNGPYILKGLPVAPFSHARLLPPSASTVLLILRIFLFHYTYVCFWKYVVQRQTHCVRARLLTLFAIHS